MNPRQQLAQKLARVRAWAGQHKAVLGVGAVGVVALVALRSRGSAGGADAGTVVPTDAGGVSGGTDPQGATIGGYDSSGSDVYNALQPQIDQTQGLIRQLMSRVKKQRRETRRLTRQLRKARRRRPHHQAVLVSNPHVPGPKKLAANRGTVSGAVARRRATPAPSARPRAVTTRRTTTLTEVGRASGTSFAQVARANRGVRPGTGVPAGRRIVLPPGGARR